MGKMNMKLMQGIEEAEGQFKDAGQGNNAPAAEKMMAADATDLYGDAKGKVPHAPQDAWLAVGENTAGEKGGAQREEKKQPKQVFSFRAAIDDIACWRAYATASGRTMEDVGFSAMAEYLHRHGLEGVEKAVYEALRERDRNR